mgnify:FL=1|tara:strand:- start:132 stop:968 length:837 start_codon:yes stop_codon:yes gene_type:complete
MKHDLSRATFIIPIKIESDDRLRNVITSICFLLDNFDTTVMVKEVDEHSRFVTEALPQIVQFCDNIDGLLHSFEHTTAPTFHRQRVLNDMIMEAKTEIVVNYDCDILLPVGSYLSAYNSILDNEADVVYPYGDGEYQYRVMADDDLVSEFLSNDFDFSILEKKSTKYDAKYGFCQFFNREVYIEGGLENENFVAYAPEDVERFYRFGTLGYSVGRLNGMVYHLEHERTPNSWFTNPHMAENNEEWNKVQKMDSETLRKYITSQDYYQRRIDGQEQVSL